MAWHKTHHLPTIAEKAPSNNRLQLAGYIDIRDQIDSQIAALCWYAHLPEVQERFIALIQTGAQRACRHRTSRAERVADGVHEHETVQHLGLGLPCP